MTNDANEHRATSEELGRAISRSVLKGVLIVLVLFAASTVQAIRYGAQLRYLFLAGGAVVSAVTVLIYGGLVAARLRDGVHKGWIPMLVAFSGVVPYVFGAYLFFYEGFWRLSALRHGFSLRVIALAASFIVAGMYWFPPFIA